MNSEGVGEKPTCESNMENSSSNREAETQISAGESSTNVTHKKDDAAGSSSKTVDKNIVPISDVLVENAEQNKPGDDLKQVLEGVNEGDVIDIDKFHTPEATDSESVPDKCDVEPMDIDEILDSLNTDAEVVTSSDEYCEAVSAVAEEKQPQLTTIDKPIPDSAKNEISEQNKVLSTGESRDAPVTEDIPVVPPAAEVNLDAQIQSPAKSDVELQEAPIVTVENIDDNLKCDEVALALDKESSKLVIPSENVEDDVQIVTSQAMPATESNAKIDATTADISAAQDQNHEQTEPNDESKLEETSPSESVSVFDLMMENKDLFVRPDESIAEPTKLNEPNELIETEVPLCAMEVNENDDHTSKGSPILTENTTKSPKEIVDEKIGENQVAPKGAEDDKMVEEQVEKEVNSIANTTVEQKVEIDAAKEEVGIEEVATKEVAAEEVKKEEIKPELESVKPKTEEEPVELKCKEDLAKPKTEEASVTPTSEEKPVELKTEEKTPFRKECLNNMCTKNNDVFYEAPEFIISHYQIRKRSKMVYVCDECYNLAVEAYSELCAALEDKQPLFTKSVKSSDLVEIIDSSDEEDESEIKEEKGEPLDAETLALIENELEAVIKETLERVDIDQQMDWNRQILTTQMQNNKKNCIEMMDEMKELQSRIDKLYHNTYNFKHSFVEEVQSLDLTTMKPTQICSESYPPAGELKHSEIKYNTLYYTFRHKLISRWLPCKVTDRVENNGKIEYKVKFCRERKESANIRIVPRKYLAYGKASENRLNIGTRVVALFDNTDNAQNKKIPLQNNFYPGIIAEPLSLYTRWRYLVFFDDGWVQYVNHENIRVVCECTENVWDLIEEPGAKTFIESYLSGFKKKRPIVQVRRGQRIQTEMNGKWYNAIVNEVDGSLVQVFFEETKRYEWIYRGSTRLFPLYKKLNHVKMFPNKSEATIEYIVIDDEKEPERSTEPPVEEQPEPKTPPSKTAPILRTFASQAARDTPQQKQRDQKRAVAKKSTAPVPKPAITHMNNSTIYVDEDKPKGKVVYYTAKKHIDVKKYLHHACQPGCLLQIQHNLSTYSPLSKPLLSGFDRQIAKTRFNKKFVFYRAPCGRRLRDMGEMHQYLRKTNSKLNVDNFTFDPLIHCLAEYVIESFVMRKADLSDGIEKMPIQLVNCYDNSMPPPCTYSAKRIPTEGVNLNCDPEFLCGCDCTDDCLDKTKCACWKLTLQGAKYGNLDTPPEDVGYQYKRLNDPVPTGIYECNSRCKCKSNCLNRVVQHPIQLKLQVFKTVNRGWGIRCLNDVPKGSFICCYAGNLLTETSANEAGGDLGDEYFAELDYIEVVENMKEGYEPEVVQEDNDSSETDEDFDVEMESMRTRNDDSDDEFVARSYTASSEDSESRRYRTRNSVDTRKKPEPAPTKETGKRKERSSSSDEDEVRQVKSFMASNTMPLNDDPDAEQCKSIRKLFGMDEAVYIMDAKKAGNIGRYFNHSCGPNLFVQNVFVDTHDLRFPWVAFFASTHIRAGSELTWNYNYEVGSVPGKVLICQCGDEKCRGRIL